MYSWYRSDACSQNCLRLTANYIIHVNIYHTAIISVNIQLSHLLTHNEKVTLRSLLNSTRFKHVLEAIEQISRCSLFLRVYKEAFQHVTIAKKHSAMNAWMQIKSISEGYFSN